MCLQTECASVLGQVYVIFVYILSIAGHVIFAPLTCVRIALSKCNNIAPS